MALVSCSPRRIPSTSTTRGFPTPASGSSAGCRPPATRPAYSTAWRALPRRPDGRSTGIGSIGCCQGWSSGCFCCTACTTTKRRCFSRDGRWPISAGRSSARRFGGSRRAWQPCREPSLRSRRASLGAARSPVARHRPVVPVPCCRRVSARYFCRRGTRCRSTASCIIVPPFSGGGGCGSRNPQHASMSSAR